MAAYIIAFFILVVINNLLYKFKFNPNKSINCQAASAATYKSLVTKSLIKEVMESSEKFTDIFKQSSTNQVMTQNTLF